MNEHAPLRIGFVGVGAIAAAVAEAILRRVDGAEALLSPRSAQRSAALARDFPGARVAADNRAVVDGSDVVFVAVLPDQVEAVCGALAFRDDQVVVGLSAGWPPSRLGPLVAPAATVCQVIPLPMIALGVGPVVVHPSVPAVERLLAPSGTIVVAESEDDLGALSCASAVMSTFFAFERTAVDWAAAQGIGRAQAAGYVTALMQGLATEAMTLAPDALGDAVTSHETPGGLNEHVRSSLERDGCFDALARHLDHILAARIRR